MAWKAIAALIFISIQGLASVLLAVDEKTSCRTNNPYLVEVEVRSSRQTNRHLMYFKTNGGVETYTCMRRDGNSSRCKYNSYLCSRPGGKENVSLFICRENFPPQNFWAHLEFIGPGNPGQDFYFKCN